MQLSGAQRPLHADGRLQRAGVVRLRRHRQRADERLARPEERHGARHLHGLGGQRPAGRRRPTRCRPIDEDSGPVTRLEGEPARERLARPGERVRPDARRHGGLEPGRRHGGDLRRERRLHARRRTSTAQASFDYTVTDNGTTNGASDPKTATGHVSFTVNAVNDAPVISRPVPASTRCPAPSTALTGYSVARRRRRLRPDQADARRRARDADAEHRRRGRPGRRRHHGQRDGLGRRSRPRRRRSTRRSPTPPASSTTRRPPGPSDTVSIGVDDLGHNGSGGHKTAAKTVSITLNQPPTANAQTVTTDEDTAKTITLTGSDPESEPLTFVVTSLPAAGGAAPRRRDAGGTDHERSPVHAARAARSRTCPAANANGTPLGSFAFKVERRPLQLRRGHGDARTSTPVDDPPVAVDDSATVAAGLRREHDRRARERHRHRRRPEGGPVGHAGRATAPSRSRTAARTSPTRRTPATATTRPDEPRHVHLHAERRLAGDGLGHGDLPAGREPTTRAPASAPTRTRASRPATCSRTTRDPAGYPIVGAQPRHDRHARHGHRQPRRHVHLQPRHRLRVPRRRRRRPPTPSTTRSRTVTAACRAARR